MLREMEYIIDQCPPIPWKRAGHTQDRFYDKQKQEKIFYGLSLKRQHGNQPMFEGPLLLTLKFYMTIPKSMIRRQMSEHHYKRPDLDNLCKFFLDAATSILWEDDAQISGMSIIKIYSDKPRTEIHLKELE